MAMTIRQILGKTPPSRRSAAEYVKIKEVKVGRTKTDGRPIVKAKSFSTHTAQGKRKNYKPYVYVSIIEVVGRNVVVSCSCDDFWSNWEVALMKQNAARQEYSNGEKPETRNPQMIPGCCKHLFALGKLLIDKKKL